MIFQSFNITKHIENQLSMLQSSAEIGFKISILLLILDSSINFFRILETIWISLKKLRDNYYTISECNFDEISKVYIQIQNLFPY